MLYERIREYLNKNRIPYSAVAEKIGKPLPIFSNMVNGKRKIEAEEYFAICEALKVSVSFFVENVA